MGKRLNIIVFCKYTMLTGLYVLASILLLLSFSSSLSAQGRQCPGNYRYNPSASGVGFCVLDFSWQTCSAHSYDIRIERCPGPHCGKYSICIYCLYSRVQCKRFGYNNDSLQYLLNTEDVEPKELIEKFRDSIANKPSSIMSSEVSQRISAIIKEYDQIMEELSKSEQMITLRGVHTYSAMSWLREATVRSANKEIQEQRQLAIIENSKSIQGALLSLLKIENLINVSLSSIPFANDARDVYESVSGYDLISGEKLSLFERSLSGLGVIVGNGKIYRSVINDILNGQVKKSIVTADELLDSANRYTGYGEREIEIFRKSIDVSKEAAFRYTLYLRGRGAAVLPVPDDYTRVSRWIGDNEVKLWINGGGTQIDPAIGSNGRVYVTKLGAPHPGSGAGQIRVDFAVPNDMLQRAGNEQWFQILQPQANTPTYNVAIYLP